MKQKLAIGRALLHRPKVLFLDEPTAGLDAETAKNVRDAILALKNTRRTIFLCTHNLEEANRLCNRIAIFKTTLLELDTPLNLRRHFGVSTRRVRVRLRSPQPEQRNRLLQAVRNLPPVVTAEWDTEGNALVLGVQNPEDDNPAIIHALVEAGGAVQFVEEQTATLEDVYLDLIKQDPLAKAASNRKN
jgi:ABC-2 type transport system ATP-binding protein